MGQEASVPAEIIDLEEQAKAPPSATLSDGTPAVSGSVAVGIFRNNNELDDDPAVLLQTEEANHHPPVAAMLGKRLPRAVGARAGAMIHQMRNLSLRNKKQEMAAEWEKQWDEDEEEDEEEVRPSMDVHSQLSIPTPPPPPPPLPPSSSKPHSSPPRMMPPTILPPATPPTTTRSTIPTTTPSTIMPTTPFDNQEWVQQAQDAMYYSSSSSIETDDFKPCVEMFLPMLRVLGKGSFGKVVLVQKQQGKESGQLFAMKILRKAHLVKRRQIERTRTERKVLSAVNHPFIMKLHYAFQTEDKLYLVLDYCPGGELFFHLSRFRRFPERVARFFAAELLLAIGHLHKRGIIYRDLKPENVLLDADGHVKLGDFGLAKVGIQHPYEGAMSMCGTPEYMAPEVLAQQGHGFCVDYWGLGMLTYEMMTGLPPWYTTDRAKLFRRLKSAPLDIPTYFSASSADCVSALLERNPRRRMGVMGIRTAMEHEFFRSISWRSLYARKVEPPIRPCEGWNVDLGLDSATANFDSQFTRMPVESDGPDNSCPDTSSGGGVDDELHADTFVGFSFDVMRSRTQHMEQQPHAHQPL